MGGPLPERLERTLRFGVLSAATDVGAALAASVRELLGTPGVELALVIVDEAPERSPRIPRALWDAYLRLRPLGALPSQQPVDLDADFAEVPRVEARDLESIRGHELDFVLHLGAGPVGGELLDLPSYGVWSFHSSDEPGARGWPLGFWEIQAGQPATGIVLERVTARPDEGAVLQRCFVSTWPASHRKTVDAVAWAGAYMPTRVARDIQNGCADYFDAQPRETGAPSPGTPRAVHVLRFVARMARAWLRGQVASLFLLERWHVGIVRQPIESFLSEGFVPDIDWLPRRRRNGFLADPFLAGDGAPRKLLMEEWDDRSGRGTIAEVDLDAGMAGEAPRTALDAGCHMAYPFTFEHEGRIYCTPETYQRRGVFLYALEHGRGWTEQATLIQDLAAVDPTVVRHDGRWWLFCTDEDVDSEGKLLLFSAPDLLGPWKPHPGNPVKADIRSCRPAGTPFVVEGELYRPAQDSAGGYGRAVVINRVTRLTATEFAEEPVARFAPPPGSPYRDGFHTIAGWGELTAVDGKVMALAPRLIVPRIARKLGRLAGRVRPRTRER